VQRLASALAVHLSLAAPAPDAPASQLSAGGAQAPEPFQVKESMLERALDDARAERAKVDAERAKVDAERAKVDAERAKVDALHEEVRRFAVVAASLALRSGTLASRARVRLTRARAAGGGQGARGAAARQVPARAA
jgi:hypothetical protein